MNSRSLILYIFIVSFIVISCNKSQTRVANSTVNDTTSVNLPQQKDVSEQKKKVTHYDLYSTDSIIDSYHIAYKSQENGEIVTTYPVTDGKGKDTICYARQDIVLSISKEGKNILSNKKIQIDDFKSFIPKNEISKYCITNFLISDMTISDIKFSINICIPETDICYLFNVIVSDDGSFKIKEVIESESDM